MMLPLYKQIYYDKDKLGASDSIKSGELLFMPTVETQRLKVCLLQCQVHVCDPIYFCVTYDSESCRGRSEIL